MPSASLRVAILLPSMVTLCGYTMGARRQFDALVQLVDRNPRQALAQAQSACTRMTGISTFCLSIGIALELLIVATDKEPNSPYADLYESHHVLIFIPACVFFFCVTLTSANRGRLRRLIGEWGLGENELRSTRSLAAIVLLMGGGNEDNLETRIREAAARFRSISFSALRPSHLANSHLTPAERFEFIGARQSATPSQVDAFVSHSWSDDWDAKYAALEKWAERFESRHGRSPRLWIDKACIDRNDLDASLAYVPIYVSACKVLIVLAGDTYCRRLWCIMEIFCFLAMGGSVGDIILLDVRSKSCAAHDSPRTQAGSPNKQMRVRGGSFRALWRSADVSGAEEQIHLEEAQCSIPEERDRMLGVIEAAYGDISLFERDIRALFCGKSTSRRWSQEPPPPTRLEKSRGSRMPPSVSKVNWYFERERLNQHALQADPADRWRFVRDLLPAGLLR